MLFVIECVYWSNRRYISNTQNHTIVKIRYISNPIMRLLLAMSRKKREVKPKDAITNIYLIDDSPLCNFTLIWSFHLAVKYPKQYAYECYEKKPITCNSINSAIRYQAKRIISFRFKFKFTFNLNKDVSPKQKFFLYLSFEQISYTRNQTVFT